MSACRASAKSLKMGDGAGYHCAKLLRFGRAGVVEDASIRLQQNTRHPKCEEMRQRLRHRGLQCLDRHAQPPGSGENRSGIDAKGDAGSRRIGAPPGQKTDKVVGHRAAGGVGVDAQMDLVERHAVQRLVERSRVIRQAISKSVWRAFEHQGEAGGAVGNIVERLDVGARRVGIVATLYDSPWRGWVAAGDRHGVCAPCCQRIDWQAVVGSCNHGVIEGLAAKRLIDEGQPAFPVRRRKGGFADKAVDIHPHSPQSGAAIISQHRCPGAQYTDCQTLAAGASPHSAIRSFDHCSTASSTLYHFAESQRVRHR